MSRVWWNYLFTPFRPYMPVTYLLFQLYLGVSSHHQEAFPVLIMYYTDLRQLSYLVVFVLRAGLVLTT